jgi:hypothetical protein
MFVCVIVGSDGCNDMENPTKNTTGPQPETWCDDQPKQTAPKSAIVDLPYTRDKGTQYCGCSGVAHADRMIRHGFSSLFSCVLVTTTN